MISDKNRGETRPNIQKESIPSASERRDEAGHVAEPETSQRNTK